MAEATDFQVLQTNTSLAGPANPSHLAKDNSDQPAILGGNDKGTVSNQQSQGHQNDSSKDQLVAATNDGDSSQRVRTQQDGSIEVAANEPKGSNPMNQAVAPSEAMQLPTPSNHENSVQQEEAVTAPHPSHQNAVNSATNNVPTTLAGNSTAGEGTQVQLLHTKQAPATTCTSPPQQYDSVQNVMMGLVLPYHQKIQRAGLHTAVSTSDILTHFHALEAQYSYMMRVQDPTVALALGLIQLVSEWWRAYGRGGIQLLRVTMSSTQSTIGEKIRTVVRMDSNIQAFLFLVVAESSCASDATNNPLAKAPTADYFSQPSPPTGRASNANSFATAPAPAIASPHAATLANTGMTTSPTATENDAILKAIQRLMRPFVETLKSAGMLSNDAVSQAGLLCGIAAQPLSMQAMRLQLNVAPQNSQNAVCSEAVKMLIDWFEAYMRHGIHNLRDNIDKFLRSLETDLGKISRLPEFEDLCHLVLERCTSASSRKRKCSPVSEERRPIAAMTEHKSVPCRNNKRQCVICRLDTDHECSHANCQNKIKPCGEKVLYGVPICSGERNNCIDMHRETIMAEQARRDELRLKNAVGVELESETEETAPSSDLPEGVTSSCEHPGALLEDSNPQVNMLEDEEDEDEYRLSL